jgi:hypothetical protein
VEASTPGRSVSNPSYFLHNARYMVRRRPYLLIKLS